MVPREGVDQLSCYLLIPGDLARKVPKRQGPSSFRLLPSPGHGRVPRGRGEASISRGQAPRLPPSPRLKRLTGWYCGEGGRASSDSSSLPGYRGGTSSHLLFPQNTWAGQSHGRVGEKAGPHPDTSSFPGWGSPRGGVRPDHDSSSMLKLLRRLLALETAGDTDESRGSEAARSGDRAPDSPPTTPSSSSIRMSSSPRWKGSPRSPRWSLGKCRSRRASEGGAGGC